MALLVALALLFYVAGIALGISITNYFFDRRIDETLVKYGFAFPIGMAIAAFLVIALEAFGGGFSDVYVLAASLVMAISSWALYAKAKTRRMFSLKILRKQIKKDRLFHVAILVSVAILVVLALYGVYQNGSGIYGGDNYGTDFLFHISIGNSQIYSGWPPKLLYAYNASNIYPFIPDTYTSILSYNGILEVTSLYMMNIPLYFSIVVLSVFLTSLIVRHRMVAVFGFWLFIFCGLGFNMLVIAFFHISLPGLPYSQVESMEGNIMQLITNPYFNFSDPLASNFAPQHDLLLGYPIALIIITMLYLVFLERRSADSRSRYSHFSLEFAFAGGLAGLMPLLHPFSLVFVFIFAAVAFVYSMCKKQRRNKILNYWIPFSIIAILLAAPQLLYMYGSSGSVGSGFAGSVLNMSFWYSSTATITQIVLMHAEFWLETIGALLVFGLLGLYFLRDRLIVFVPGFLGLVMVNFIRLSPNFGDSNKIVLWFLLFMGASAAILLYKMWQRGLLFRILAFVFFAIVVFSGVAAEYYDVINGGYPIATNVELQAAGWMRNSTAPSSVFVSSCYDTVFSLSSSLGGRKTLMEFKDYMGLVGLSNYNITAVDTQIQDFMQRPDCAFARRYNVSYVVLENLTTFAPSWCDSVNYTAFSRSNDFTIAADFNGSEPQNRILIYKSRCA